MNWMVTWSEERRGESAKVKENTHKKMYCGYWRICSQLLCICIVRLEYEVTAFFAALLCRHNCIVSTVAVAVAAAVEQIHSHDSTHRKRGGIFRYTLHCISIRYGLCVISSNNYAFTCSRMLLISYALARRLTILPFSICFWLLLCASNHCTQIRRFTHSPRIWTAFD